MLPELLSRPFESLINRGLGQSTTARAIARALEGRSLGLTVDGTPLDLRLRVAGERLTIGMPDGVAPDASIGGSVLSLGRLLRGDPQAPIREGDVRISGDTEIAEQFRDLLRFATPDLEEELARLVGDPLAHQAGNAVRAIKDWSEAAGRSVTRSMSEYLQEESGLLATKSEVRDFTRAVDELVNDVARAEARIRLLEQAE
jgi:ubiquinone biosynthesis protein UbiJ